MGQLGRIALTAAIGVALLAACAKSGGGAAPTLPAAQLDHFIGDEIGDPSTCVILARRADRKALYQYGEVFNCVRGLPACDRAGLLTAQQGLALADTADGRGASCPSSPDGSRRVGWAEGRVQGRDLVYSAVMEGQRALPGQEISARLEEAFTNAGLETPGS